MLSGCCLFVPPICVDEYRERVEYTVSGGQINRCILS